MYQGIPCKVLDGVKRTRQGYGDTNIRRFGRAVNSRHRLAWIEAHGMFPPPETPYVLHHCDNPPCEEPAHLYAGTHADNMRDRRVRGRYPYADHLRGYFNRVPGEGRVNHRLTDDAVRQARRDYAAGTTIADLARRCGVSRPTMRNALNRVTWRHVE